MAKQNLSFNIITFQHPEEQKLFQFVTEKKEGFFPLRNYKLPANVLDIISAEDINKDIPLYTNFEEDVQGDLELNVTLNDSPDFAKHYYRSRIYNYFKKINEIVRFNYIGDIEVWIKAKDKNNNPCTFFHKFGIRVQFEKVSDNPELLLYYIGKSRIFNKNLENLPEISPTQYGKVFYKKEIHKYQRLPDEVREELNQVYPVVNEKLEKELGLEMDFEYVTNKYTHIHNYINDFLKAYLYTEDFKKVALLSNDGFLKVNPENILNVASESNKLEFEDGDGVVPKKDIWRKKPYEKQKNTNLQFIFIYHEKSKDAYDKAFSYFKGNNDFYGISKFVNVPFHYNESNNIVLSDGDNTIDSIKDKFKNFTPESDITYFAIYISPFTKEVKDPTDRKLYYKVKEALLNSFISSQVIEEETIFDKGFKWSMTNIGIAILAKLGGIPWIIQTPFKRELIFGVGAFENQEHGVKYIGNTFCFSTDGHFKEFDCYSHDEMFLLAGDIELSIIDFQKKHRNFRLERLIIHFYKTMSAKELKPIMKVLERLKLKIPIFIVSINKTDSEDYLVFDDDYSKKMPVSGTIVPIGNYQYLLCNNSRYSDIDNSTVDGFHLPIKIKLTCSEPEQLNDEVAQELIDQVYQFSRIYWKALKQQNLPVTIKYPEMVAQIAPHFKDGIIPDYGKDNLWFL